MRSHLSCMVFHDDNGDLKAPTTNGTMTMSKTAVDDNAVSIGISFCFLLPLLVLFFFPPLPLIYYKFCTCNKFNKVKVTILQALDTETYAFRSLKKRKFSS